MHILFLVPYPIGSAPSQRFRFEQYFSLLVKNGYSYEVRPFWDINIWHLLYCKGHLIKKIIGLIKGYWGRISCLLSINRFDKVFVHREVTPLGLPLFEYLISKVFKIPLVYDFDDTIWLHDSHITRNTFLSWLKYSKKVSSICRWSHKISCGNQYLANYARQYNSIVFINPTTIDTVSYHIPQYHENDPIVIGWTGTHSTIPYLEMLLPALEELSTKQYFIFKVICNVPPTFNLPGLKFIEWKKEQEIEDLNSIDIGIMPLVDNAWTKGKCGFKILQYMALKKATIASAVGVNTEIIDHGHNGLLCSNQSEWLYSLELLMLDEALRTRLGQNGRTLVEQKYSVVSNSANFLKLFI